MKNLKYCQNCDRLNIEMIVCTEQMHDIHPYGTYVLLGSLEFVLREHSVLLGSLKSMMSMYNNVMWTVTVSLSGVSVNEIVSLHG